MRILLYLVFLSISDAFYGTWNTIFHPRQFSTLNRVRICESIEGKNNHSEYGPEDLEGLDIPHEKLEREVAKHKLQVEIDSILNDPEGPLDLEHEMKKVTGGISPPLTTGTEEALIEQKVYEIESEMFHEIKNENFDRAQSRKDELNQMHMDDCCNVIFRNAEFYRHFSEKDYSSMESLWIHDASALCIHPSGSSLIGSSKVLASFKEMFQKGNKSFQTNRIEPSNIRLSVKGTTAIVTCDEEVYTKRFYRGRNRENTNTENGMELVNKFVTTNIFRKVGGRWYMSHHHASWHPDSEASKDALKSQGSKKSSDVEDLTVESVLGIPGHVGLGGKAPKESNGGKVQASRIFTGSLSELLTSGLLGGASSDEGNEDNDEDSGMEIDDIIGVSKGIIIQSSDKASDENDSYETDDDSDDDDNDNEIVMKNANTSPKIIDMESTKAKSKESTPQLCISSLRKLASTGLISHEDKIVLLTDIITKSSRGERSLVEVAHDLLCGDECIDKDAGELDFADQCKVFASVLQEGSPQN